MACWFHDPAVSMATKKKTSLQFFKYFAVLLTAACWAAAPCSAAGTLTPQVISFTLAQGIRVAPSGRLLSLLMRPADSLTEQRDKHHTVMLLSVSASAAGSLSRNDWRYTSSRDPKCQGHADDLDGNILKRVRDSIG